MVFFLDKKEPKNGTYLKFPNSVGKNAYFFCILLFAITQTLGFFLTVKNLIFLTAPFLRSLRKTLGFYKNYPFGKSKKNRDLAAAGTASFFGASEASSEKDRVEDGKTFRKMQNCVALNFSKKNLSKGEELF